MDLPRLAIAVAAALVAASCTSSSDRLLVTSGFTDEVIAMDPTNGAIIERISIDPRPGETDEPHGIVMAPDGRFWFATVSHGEPTLWKYELPANRLVGRVRLGIAGAARIGVTPDGRRGFVPDYYRDGGGTPSEIAVVRLYDLEVLRRIRVCPAPHDAQVDPTGAVVAVTCSLSDEIVMLDAENFEELHRFPVDHAAGAPGSPRHRPLNLAWSSTGDTLLVTLHHANIVRGFDETGTELGDVAVGNAPAQLAASSDGRTLVVANRGDATVSIVDVATLVERARVTLPADAVHPHGVTVAPNGKRAFITYEGNAELPGGVAAIDLERAAVDWQRTAGAYTLGIIYVAARN